MKIIEFQQRSPEWHAWRKGGIGSSDMSVLMGCNPYKKLIDVYEDKHSLSDIIHDNEAIKRGVNYENEALTWIVSVLGVDIIPLCIEQHDKTWMRASLDGYNKDQDFVVEIKIPLEKNFEKQSTIMEEMHYCQIQWHLLVSGCKSAYLCVYSPEKKEGSLRFISPDKEYQEKMQSTSEDFWFNYVVPMNPPKKNEIFEISDLRAIELARELETYVELRKKFELLESDLKASILEYSIGSSFSVGNFIFRLQKSYKRLDKDLMKKDGIDLSKYEVEGDPYYKLELKK